LNERLRLKLLLQTRKRKRKKRKKQLLERSKKRKLLPQGMKRQRKKAKSKRVAVGQRNPRRYRLSAYGKNFTAPSPQRRKRGKLRLNMTS